MNRVSQNEARNLTEALGDSWVGGAHYSNANSRATRALRLNELPEDAEGVQEQIERSRAVIAPYIGRLATIKTSKILLYENDQWDEMYILGRYRVEAQRATGMIAGVEGHRAGVRIFNNNRNTLEEYSRQPINHNPHLFHIGVVLSNLTDDIEVLPHSIEMPFQPERVMLPICTLPRSVTPANIYNDRIEPTL